jgi:hypothetical protein
LPRIVPERLLSTAQVQPSHSEIPPCGYRRQWPPARRPPDDLPGGITE